MTKVCGDVMHERQVELLVRILMHRDGELGERDDAAMLLGSFDHPEAEDALIEVVFDAATDPDLAESCAESLGEIWSRKDSFDPTHLRRLRGIPLALAVGVIEMTRPEWRELTQRILED